MRESHPAGRRLASCSALAAVSSCLGGPGADDPIRLEMAAALAPGEEAILCVEERLDNDAPLLVGALRVRLSGMSHHAVVYASDAPVERPDPFPCAPFSGAAEGRAFPLIVAQNAEQEIELPPGVAFEIAPRQMIRVELHGANPREGVEVVAAEVDLLPAPGDALDRAGVAFYVRGGFEVGPRTRSVVRSAPMEAPEGARLFALAGHTHARGTGVRVERAARGGAGAETLYDPDPWDWEEPPLAVFDPPLALAPGDRLRLDCEYRNPGDTSVHDGLSSREEMCAFWAYYHPAQAFRAYATTAGPEGTPAQTDTALGPPVDPAADPGGIGPGEPCPTGTGCAEGLECWFISIANALACTARCDSAEDCAAAGGCCQRAGTQSAAAVCVPEALGVCPGPGDECDRFDCPVGHSCEQDAETGASRCVEPHRGP